MLVQVAHLDKSFGTVELLRDVSFALARGERAGLVGANGAGKTTLLRIVGGLDTPARGSVSLAPSVELGYLPQSTPAFSGSSIDDLIRESVGALRHIEARMRELEARMARARPEAAPPLLDEYGALAQRFQDRGGYELDHRIEAVLAGLDLAYLDRTRQVTTLSGGERARVGLAALLLRTPDVLLLDEPTNHLDTAALDWLEGYLAAYSGALLVVSHDRQFLNATVRRILVIDDQTRTLRRFEGDYDAYTAAWSAEVAKREEDYGRRQDETAALRKRIRETGHQVAHNRGPTDNDKSAYNAKGENVARAISRNVRAAQEQLARLEAEPLEKPPKPLRFAPRFRGERLSGRAVVTARGLAKVFGTRPLFRDLECALAPDARVLLAGPNGTGKTTLLRVLMGLEEPDAGSVRLSPGARIGYLPQEPAAADPAQTLLDAYRDGLEGLEGTIVASILGNGLFRLEDLVKRVGQLSLGQRRKLEIARLVALGPNVLLLDEPTNYLSLDVLEAFEAAVLDFPGPVVAVSHDRWFMRRFGGEVWRLADGCVQVEGRAFSPGTA
ncbi:MAG TPA: ABC-F family ATP-binding cassette domain-containing protein [Ktedonobacterales bacterium]